MRAALLFGWSRLIGARGSTLLYIIGAMVVLGAIGAGVTIMSSSSSQSKVEQEAGLRAFYNAQSGLNYIVSMQRANEAGGYNINTFINALGGNNSLITYNLPNNGQYSYRLLTNSANSSGGDYIISYLKGSVVGDNSLPYSYLLYGNASSRTEVYKKVPITLKSFSGNHPENKDYSITLFNSDQSQAPTGYNADVWETQYNANVDKYGGQAWLRFSNDLYDSNGAIWYTGNYGECTTTPCAAGTCKEGQCGLGTGFRTVFSFIFHNKDQSSRSTDFADVFTFALMTATNNDPATACGGPSDSYSIGEYLGYAGLGKYGVGIKPPKMAVEVDTFPNGCDDVYTRDYHRNLIPQSNSRCDNSDANHIAVVYWGDSSTNRDPYYADDNRHGAGGSGNDPVNPIYNRYCNINSTCGYYEVAKGSSQYNWLEDGNPHTMRIEIIRNVSTRVYEIRAWVVDGVPTDTDAFMDVTSAYSGLATKMIDYKVTLSSSDSNKLDQIFFGWTEGTGGSTQNADIYNFKLFFNE